MPHLTRGMDCGRANLGWFGTGVVLGVWKCGLFYLGDIGKTEWMSFLLKGT